MTHHTPEAVSADPGWLERQLERGSKMYRAIQFAHEHPDIVNSIADEMGYQPPEPKI